jgi:hypothetical protein
MTEKKHVTTPAPSIAKDNHSPATIKKNFVPQTGREVQGNHIPTTSEKPSTPPPNPKKK